MHLFVSGKKGSYFPTIIPYIDHKLWYMRSSERYITFDLTNKTFILGCFIVGLFHTFLVTYLIKDYPVLLRGIQLCRWISLSGKLLMWRSTIGVAMNAARFTVFPYMLQRNIFPSALNVSRHYILSLAGDWWSCSSGVLQHYDHCGEGTRTFLRELVMSQPNSSDFWKYYWGDNGQSLWHFFVITFH